MNESPSDARRATVLRQMTVARVRMPPEADHVEVMFFESARVYRLLEETPSFEAYLGLLQEASRVGTPLAVTFGSLESDLIESVAPVES